MTTSQLMLKVSTAPKLLRADPEHKLQVLLRSEVHWLTFNSQAKQQYEDSMLAYLG